ncbi:MAG: hypothetical protein COW63_10790 [Bacteroidetes bacterium CG18_big_fil_WC_8_21_14_2_50_41_14]|nr:MAG: hypothetical protein COW63_10790 [Bacteroidetes bacterium CG18_big_fil_WC_8_21_14_2_50_41_14]PIY34096.1 MAG: hypothetical protein COZ08_03780 [Bacteroidetes bacterium CG_4_10_14_3_um_filter_42_6]
MEGVNLEINFIGLNFRVINFGDLFLGRCEVMEIDSDSNPLMKQVADHKYQNWFHIKNWKSHFVRDW